MNMNDLRAMGAFIPGEPEKVSIEWKGNTFDVHVKRLAFGDVEQLMSAEGSRSAAMLAAAVLLGDEREPLTLADAERLDVSLAGKLIEAVNKVNGLVPTEGADPK